MSQSLIHPSKLSLPFFGVLIGLSLPYLSVIAQEVAPPNEQTVFQTNQPSQTAFGKVKPNRGKIDLIVTNNVLSLVTYEVSGQTSTRSLKSGRQILLRNLTVPATLNLQRSDGGLIKIIPISTGRESVLGIEINSANGLSDSHLTLNVEKQGKVFAY